MGNKFGDRFLAKMAELNLNNKQLAKLFSEHGLSIHPSQFTRWPDIKVPKYIDPEKLMVLGKIFNVDWVYFAFGVKLWAEARTHNSYETKADILHASLVLLNRSGYDFWLYDHLVNTVTLSKYDKILSKDTGKSIFKVTEFVSFLTGKNEQHEKYFLEDYYQLTQGNIPKTTRAFEINDCKIKGRYQIISDLKSAYLYKICRK